MKKKFRMSLENELKPDISFMIKQAESEFEQYANDIYKTEGEAVNRQDDFNIQDLYKMPDSDAEDFSPELEASYLKLLKEAHNEVLDKAKDIFKEEFGNENE